MKGHFLSVHTRKRMSCLISPRSDIWCAYILALFCRSRAGDSDNSPTTISSWTAHTDVLALNGSLWGPESQTDVLVPSPTTLADSGGLLLALGVQEDVWLLLESALALDSQFGGHDCGGSGAIEVVVGCEVGGERSLSGGVLRFSQANRIRRCWSWRGRRVGETSWPRSPNLGRNDFRL